MSCCLVFLDQMHNYSPMERSIAVTDFFMSEPLPLYGSSRTLLGWEAMRDVCHVVLLKYKRGVGQTTLGVLITLACPYTSSLQIVNTHTTGRVSSRISHILMCAPGDMCPIL
jgi:hypothetical protein